ncbi:LAQU0S01e06700g1_1 [Lachancea quebecensis]|uniref:Altered inheritance of mitochondria protein 41 n=1 Tax=Lachancea quebecensis TaxID=1654605 RepID=A0A0P1KLC8_9SACH|nr:LAQU0S01e06700g1_1 [Lachancea quebecensis]
MLARRANIGLPKNLSRYVLTSARFASSQSYVDSVAALKKDLKKAMIAKDDLKKTTIRGLLSGIKNKEIDAQGKDLDEFALHDLYSKLITQRKDSIEEFLKNNRSDLVEREESEIKIIKNYLEQLPVASEAEVDAKVSDLLTKLKQSDPSLQLKDAFKKFDWKATPSDWRASAGMIKASIVRQFKARS